MSFYETPLRRLHLIKAGGLFAIAAAIAVLFVVQPTDELGKLFGSVFIVLCLVLGFSNVRGAKRAPASAYVTTIPERCTVARQVQYYRRFFWLSAISFPVVGISSAWCLYQLEFGGVAKGDLWGPIAAIYGRLGFWPAVLFTPILGAACITIAVFKLRRLRDNSEEENTRDDGKDLEPIMFT